MHVLQGLFYLTTVLHVSGITITQLQEHKTTVTTASGNRYTVLLSVTIVEELEILYKNIITKHGPMNVKINLHSGVLLVVFVIIS